MRLALPVAAVLALSVDALAEPPRAPPTRPRPAPPPRATCPLRAGQQLAGTYLCAQGWTRVTLTVRELRAPWVRAEFAFRHDASGAAGRFTLTGSCDPDGRVRLAPEAWVERPAGYIMVGMDGVAAGARFDGRMAHPSCGAFSLETR